MAKLGKNESVQEETLAKICEALKCDIEDVVEIENYIFDCCRNFEFFEENDRGIETGNTISLTEKIYTLKLDMITEMEGMEYQAQEEYKNYREELVNEFVTRINGLNRDSFIVRNKTVYVDKYSSRDKWNHIDYTSYDEIKEHLIPIFMSEDSDECAKRFDNLVYGIQIGRMRLKNIKRQTALLSELVENLKKLGTIPEFKDDEIFKVKIPLIKEQKNVDIILSREKLRELIYEFIKDSEGRTRQEINDYIYPMLNMEKMT